MEKLTGPKHNHLLTDLVKVCIFTLMLLLPFLCFIPTSLYYAFNEHAVVNTEEKPVYQYEQVDFNQLSIINDFEYTAEQEGAVYTLNNSLDFELDNIYLIQVSQSFTYSTISRNIPILQINFNLTPIETYFTIETGDLSVSTIENVILTSGSHYAYIKARSSFTAELMYWVNDGNIDNNYYHVNFYNLTQMFGSGNEPTYNVFLQYYPLKDYDYTLSKTEIVKRDTGQTKNYADITSNITNAWEDLWKSPVFNWTNYTPLNTGLNGFISIFGINQSSYIANCLVYLLSITAIYVVFDIVLGIFKWLTHLINK